MCPDTELLSAYYDGELDDSHSAAVSLHVEGCSKCKAELAQFQRLSNELSADAQPVQNMGKEGMWEHVRIRALASGGGALWQRTISMPAPVALVFTAAVVCLSIGLFVAMRQAEPATVPAVSIAERIPEDLPLSEAAWRYLDQQRERSQFVLTLPGDTEYRLVSQPSFVRAAEYHRGGE